LQRFSEGKPITVTKKNVKVMKTRLQLTKNFSIEEFDCHDGTQVPSSLYPNLNSLVLNLQVLREHVNKPIHVLSGYRSATHNKECGGSPHSQHLLARAADLRMDNISPYSLHQVIEDLIKEGFLKEGGLGLYDTFVHYDVRGFKARWDLREHK
jgi:uncharacterized protein YcbK (DUF882 family)